MKHFKRRYIFIGAAMICLLVGATACGDSGHAPTSTASCAFIVGDGKDGRNAKLHTIAYPGQTIDLDQTSSGDDKEDAYYVPCNSRNYIINDGSVKNANKGTVGDRTIPIYAYTSSGVKLQIWASAFWTLNQSKSAMEHFWELCHKYNCASSNDKGGDVNFSTAGWNGMLGETFGPVMDKIAAVAAYKADDTIWQNHDPSEYDKLATAMSQSFADAVRAEIGYPQDLFCGSGNSGWEDPNKPGNGNFTCTNVRITVEKVERAQVNTSDNSSAGVAKINEQRLKNAQALYGDQAGYWLALQDSIAACKASRSTCVFNVGNPPTVTPGNTSGTPASTP